MNPSNAPTPVTLSDGSVVIVSPLTAKDMATIFNFVRQKELSRLLTAIPKDTDPETKKMMIKLAYEESSQFSRPGWSAWPEIPLSSVISAFTSIVSPRILTSFAPS